jgi:hypothetical protein
MVLLCDKAGSNNNKRRAKKKISALYKDNLVNKNGDRLRNHGGKQVPPVIRSFLWMKTTLVNPGDHYVTMVGNKQQPPAFRSSDGRQPGQ